MTTSPSRTYVAMCRKTDFFRGFYFKEFVLPETYENTSDMARWYFLNELCFTAYVESILTIEDYRNISKVEEQNG